MAPLWVLARQAFLAPSSRAFSKAEPALRFRSAGRQRGSAPRRPGAHQAMRENAADVLQIDQRVAALERARRAATQIVPGLAEQASQLEVAEGLKC